MEIMNGTDLSVSEKRAAMTRQPAKSSQRTAAGTTAKVAREFESLFIEMMFKSMRETIGRDSLTGGGRGEEIYRSMLDQEYARALTEHSGVGLAALLERQLEMTADGTAGNQADENNHGTTNPSDKTEAYHENQ